MAINSDIQQQVFDLLSKSSNLSFVSVEQEAGGRTTLALSPGQRVTAEVLTTLANNRVQVQIGTERFNLDLPMSVRPGQNLEMTFVSSEPRATFAIARMGVAAPPVSLSDASRLLGLMVGDERSVDPALRVSLQSISDMLRRSSGEAGVLANLMDEALVYAPSHQAVKVSSQEISGKQQQPSQPFTADQSRLAAFESNAAQILQHIARNSRFTLVEAVNQPVSPLPLMPGQEVNAAVIGTLPGSRAFVSVAGSALELIVPRNVKADEILRLTFISAQPKPLFAIARSAPDVVPGVLSEAGRWLSVLEHTQGGVSSQQMFVLERLNTVLQSLPASSPAFAAIKDEAVTYQNILQNRQPPESLTPAGAATITAGQAVSQQGNGIILSDDMGKLLQALIKGNRLALLEAIGQQAMPSSVVPGQQLKAEVMMALGGGRFMVQVAGQALEFNVPKGTARGDRLNLFFISNNPQPTFLLTRTGRMADAQVSNTGRWLSGFLGGAVEQQSALATFGVLRTLLDEPPVDSIHVGRMLQQGLRESGLFYESHLARWFGGDFPLADLAREPQGRFSHLKQLAVVLPSADSQTEDLARATLKTGSLEVLEAMIKRAGMSQHQDVIADQRILPVVHEQLTALQNSQILYRGDLFPGQQMEWTVSERDAHRNKEGEQERSWDTSLQITLPKLGAISARLKLDGDRVSIDIRAGESASVGVLDSGRLKLIEQLQAAGLTPEEIGIKHEAP